MSYCVYYEEFPKGTRFTAHSNKVRTRIIGNTKIIDTEAAPVDVVQVEMNDNGIIFVTWCDPLSFMCSNPDEYI